MIVSEYERLVGVIEMSTAVKKTTKPGVKKVSLLPCFSVSKNCTQSCIFTVHEQNC